MIDAGKSAHEVARIFKVHKRTIFKWMAKKRQHGSLKNKVGRGLKSKISRVTKIVIAKSLGKRHFSTRKLASKLTRSGHSVSHTTVHNYLRKKSRRPCLQTQKNPQTHGIPEEAATPMVQSSKILDRIGLEERNIL